MTASTEPAKERRAPGQAESLTAAYRDAFARRDFEEIERLDAVPREPKEASRD